ncbi:hypothetical protein KCU99_g235, partial [Aureobasidium melanogenum]
MDLLRHNPIWVSLAPLPWRRSMCLMVLLRYLTLVLRSTMRSRTQHLTRRSLPLHPAAHHKSVEDAVIGLIAIDLIGTFHLGGVVLVLAF